MNTRFWSGRAWRSAILVGRNPGVASSSWTSRRSKRNLSRSVLRRTVRKRGRSCTALQLAPTYVASELLRSLSETTAEVCGTCRPVPSGTAWVEYRLPEDYLLIREWYEAREREGIAFGPTTLRFTVERIVRKERPVITLTASIAEVMRRAVMARFSAMSGGTATRRLAGKYDGGGKREGHDHPFYLPTDEKKSTARQERAERRFLGRPAFAAVLARNSSLLRVGPPGGVATEFKPRGFYGRFLGESLKRKPLRLSSDVPRRAIR